MLKTIKKNDLVGYVYIVPSLILLFIFKIIPIVQSFVFSFLKYNIIQPATFLGLENYKRLFTDPFIKASIRNTIVYTFSVVPSQTILAIIIAVLITRRIQTRWVRTIRNILFIPVMSSTILVAVIWRVILSSQNGLLNNLLGLLSIEPLNWLGTKSLAMVSICMASVWKNTGYFAIIYIAAIFNISKSYYEAAEVDGASKWQQVKYITLPLLKNTTFFVVILGTIWSFQVFGLAYTLTNGGPGVSTVTLVMSIYNAGFKDFNMGYASAIAYLLFLIIVIISTIQSKLINKKEA